VIGERPWIEDPWCADRGVDPQPRSRRGDERSRGDWLQWGTTGAEGRREKRGSGTCRSHLLRVRVRVLHPYKPLCCGGATLPTRGQWRHECGPRNDAGHRGGESHPSLEHVHSYVSGSPRIHSHIPRRGDGSSPQPQSQPQSQSQSQSQPHTHSRRPLGSP
jgi:hypothetical protein